jgi:hypothetical protein
MEKEQIKKREQELIELTGIFCKQNLDQDYFELCEKLVKKMGRKRDVPFRSGKIEIWAAAVVYAIGSINFLFDKSFEPFATPNQISEHFGTKNSTVSNKARQIKDMFKMDHYSSEFSTQKMVESNPFNSMVMVDGFMVPLSSIPEELQEMVKAERAQGRDIQFSSKSE